MWTQEPEPTEPVIALDVLVEDETVGVMFRLHGYPGHQLYGNMWRSTSVRTAGRNGSSSGT